MMFHAITTCLFLLVGSIIQPSVQGRASIQSLGRNGLKINTAKVEKVIEAYPQVARLLKTVNSVINPNGYECEDSPLRTYVEDITASLDEENYQVVQENFATFWPFIYAGFYSEADDDVFVVDQRRTKEYQRRLDQLEDFWDIKFPTLQRRSMNGAILQDTELMVSTLLDFEFYGNATEAEVRETVLEVQDAIESDPNLGYDFPLFSFNAVAFFTNQTDPESEPPKIVMGEGLVFYGDSEANDAILTIVTAHEYGHILTLSNLLPVTREFSPEGTRYLELMADYFAAYFGAHIKGATYRKQKIVQAIQTAFDTGDCFFSSFGHHGTPNQRAAAVEFAVDLAQAAGPTIHTAQEVLDAFNAVYDDIIAPDFTAFDVSVSGTGTSGSATFEGLVLYNGGYEAEAFGLVTGTVLTGVVPQDPDQSFDKDDGFSNKYDFVLSGVAAFRIAVPPESVYDQFEVDIDIFVVDPSGEVVAQSTRAGTDEQVNIAAPADGTWSVYVQGWETGVDDTVAFSMYTWVVPEVGGGSLTVDEPSGQIQVTDGETVSVEVSWTGAADGELMIGAVSHTTIGGELKPSGRVTIVEVDNRVVVVEEE